MNFFQRLINKFMSTGIFVFLPDSLYLKLRYKLFMSKKLDLRFPKSFNEKIQWLKINDRNPRYADMVDKYKVREYIADAIGDKYLVPLLGVWNSADDIDFDALPERFVLKCNHNSGGLVVCRNKSELDVDATRNFLDKSLKKNFYNVTKEWPYKNVCRKIIAEQYMEDESHGSRGLIDYKIYCFGGKAKLGYVSQGLDNHSTARISYVTLDWKQQPFRRTDYEVFDTLPPKPSGWEEMIRLAEKLSAGIRFLRVDFYEINGRVYFGELTFYPGSGFTELTPEEWDYKLGDMIDLHSKE